MDLEGSDTARAAGNVALEEGRLEDAMKHYTLAIDLSPRDYRPWLNRSVANAKAGSPLLALGDAMHVALSLNPKSVKALLR